VCTYTKGFYRNHASVTAAVITFMGGTVRLGAANLSATRAQAVLNATPNDGSNVTYTSNLLLNLAQQVITAELNIARGATVTSTQQSAINAANAGITVNSVCGQIRLTTSLSDTTAGALTATIENFNSASDCG
jgi:hypothetical protein